MTKPAMAATGVLLIGIGVVLGLFLRAKHMINYPKILGGGGDPPVLVSDGSFYVISEYDWLVHNATTLVPNGQNTAAGTLMDTCYQMPMPAGSNAYPSVEFFDGGEGNVAYHDLSPANGQALNLVIGHGSKMITVTTATGGWTQLTITDPDTIGGGWGSPSGYYHKAQDKSSDYIKDVTTYGPDRRQIAHYDSKNPGNASVAFCYQ
jgi:hypothetical protein